MVTYMFINIFQLIFHRLYNNMICWCIVGLQMMIEIQKKDISAEPWYICELCQERTNWKTVSPHIVSLKHRILYLVC